MTKLPGLMADLLRPKAIKLEMPAAKNGGAASDKTAHGSDRPFRDLFSVIARESEPKTAAHPAPRMPVTKIDKPDKPDKPERPRSAASAANDGKDHDDDLPVSANRQDPASAPLPPKVDMPIPLPHMAVSTPAQPAPHESKPTATETRQSVLESLRDVVSNQIDEPVLAAGGDTPQKPGIAAPTPAKPSAAGGSNATMQAAASAEHPVRAATKVAVLQQETHFQPVTPQALPQTIADFVGTEINGLTDQAAGARPVDGAASPLDPQTGGPTRVLTLRLDPPSLGTVTVKLRLTGGAVEVELTAARAETVQMLQQQRDALTDLMRSAGYSADVALVQHGRGVELPGAAATPALPLHHQMAMPQHGQQAAFDTPNLLSGDAQGGGRQNRNDSQRRQEKHDRDDTAPGRAGGAILL